MMFYFQIDFFIDLYYLNVFRICPLHVPSDIIGF